MKISVQLFAAAKEAAGQSPLEVILPDNASVGELRAALVRQADKLQHISDSLLFAVNNQYANDDRLLQHDDEVACFPPVSGG